jgi:hypothetical protein
MQPDLQDAIRWARLTAIETDTVRRAKAAWRASMLAAGLNVLGMAIDLMIARSVKHVPLWPNLMSMAAGATIFALLALGMRKPDRRIAGYTFLLNAAVITAALWFSNAAYAGSGQPWVPFQADKLGMVTVALLAPELWVGLIGIAGYALASVAQLFTFTPLIRSGLAIGEPWATVAIAVFCGVLLAFRVRRDKLESQMTRTREEAIAVGRLTKILLDVRDLSNTPLQTISLSSALIRETNPELGPTLNRIDRALERLTELSTTLKRYESPLAWVPLRWEAEAGGRDGVPPRSRWRTSSFGRR